LAQLKQNVEKNLEDSTNKKSELIKSMKGDFENRKSDLEDKVNQVNEATSELLKKDDIISKLRLQIDDANEKVRK